MKANFIETRIEMARIMMGLFQFAEGVKASDVEDQVHTPIILGILMAQLTRHATTTLTIIDNPDVVRPVDGRCIFF